MECSFTLHKELPDSNQLIQCSDPLETRYPHVSNLQQTHIL